MRRRRAAGRGRSGFGEMAWRGTGSKHFKCPPIFVGSIPVSPDPPYSRRWCYVTDEYRPRIFVSDVVSPMNIWDGSKLNWTAHIFIGVRPKPTNINYIRRFRVPMNII
jgi:hypothetical protein